MPATATATPKFNDDNAASAEALWRAFFSLHKITDGKTDGAGACALRLNGLRTIGKCLTDEGLLVVQLHIAALPKVAALRGPFCEALLVQATDVLEGDVVGIDTVEDAAVYQRTLSLTRLSAQALTDELWDMADAVAELKPLLPKTA